MDNHLEDRYIRFDWAIKRLLRQKANFGVLEGLITVFLGEKVTILEILESESNQQSIDDKFNRVDIKARNSKDEIIIIEIQNTRELYYLERILYGVAKAITEHISLGETYYHVKKIYSISILYFDIGIGSDYLYYGQNNFIGVHTGDKLQVNVKEKNAIVTRMPAEIFPEYVLIRVNEVDKVAISSRLRPVISAIIVLSNPLSFIFRALERRSCSIPSNRPSIFPSNLPSNLPSNFAESITSF